MRRCLICYDLLNPSENDYHHKCLKKFYGTSETPLLPYSLDEMYKLANQVVQSSVTIPGVQAKLSVGLQKAIDGAAKITIVGLEGNYILKPPGEHYPSLPENDDMTMHLAEICGIEVVPHALLRLKSGELAYISKRIDRKGNEKLQMEDMCQLSGRLTEDKYKSSMEQVGKVIRKYSTNPIFDVLKFFEVSLFSYLTGNTDMHLKNFSLLQYDDVIRFSPSYDLLSTRLLIPEYDDPEEMALTLNGEKSNLQLIDFRKFGENLLLNKKQIQNVFDKILSHKENLINFIGISFLSGDLKEKYVTLLSSRFNKIFP